MAILNILVSAPPYWSSNIQYGFVLANACDIINGPTEQQQYQIGASQNLTTTPPTFTDSASALAYYQSALCAATVNDMNAQTPTGTYYTGYHVETVDTPTAAMIAALEAEIPTLTSQLSNDVPFVSAASLTTALSGYATTTALAGKQNTITTGTSAQYLKGDLSLGTTPTALSAFTNDAGFITSAPVQSVAGRTGTVTLAKSDVGLSNVVNLDTSNASNLSSGTLPAARLPTSGATAGSYTNTSLTVDATGRISAVSNGTGTAARAFTNNPVRTIQTVAAAGNGWLLSSTRDAQVSYSIGITVTASIASGQSGYVVFEIATTNSSTASDWAEIGRIPSSQIYTLAVAIQGVQLSGGDICKIVPAGYYARLRSVNVTGTPTYTFNSGQEVLI